jgi:hypothetical protein
MSVRFRFSLKSLMITAAVVSALLGYTQWRRICLMREARELESEGFYLLWDGKRQSGWQRWLPDWLWPVFPAQAAGKYYVLPGQPTNQFWFGSKIYTDEEANRMWQKMCDRLRAKGVEFIRCDVDGKVGNSGTSTHHG